MGEFADLPNDLLILILSNLFGKDKQNCRLVCKSWNDAILVSPYHSFPCLTFYQKSTLWKFYQYDKFYFMQVPGIHNADIVCSRYGWLLMSHDQLDLFLFHPFRGEISKVPISRESYTTLTFFNPPTSSDCIIVGVFGMESSVSIGMLRLTEYRWKHYKWNFKRSFNYSSCTPILRGELLYFLDVEGNVGTFNVVKRSGFKVHANCLSPSSLRGKLKQHFLIKLDKKKEEEATILAVFVAYDQRKVGVYRLMEPDMKWQLVEDLGDKMLFLSQTWSFAKIAPTKSMRNNIYFTQFYGASNIFYSLETKMYHSIDGAYNHRSCYGLAERDAAWIIPT